MADAIRKVFSGERYLSAKVAQEMAINSLADSQESRFSSLTEREMQVLLMITNGLNMQDMIDRLFLSAKTINGYRYRAFAKLGVKNDVELTFLALKHGLVDRAADS
jgi:two-component system invasion response regulator UvrY